MTWLSAIAFLVALIFFLLFPDSDAISENGYIKITGPVVAFIVVLSILARWHAKVEQRRELAKHIAQMAAAKLVRESGGDISALNTAYFDDRQYLASHFRHQGKAWVNSLLEEFKHEAQVIAHQSFPTLGPWRPKDDDIPVVVDV